MDEKFVASKYVVGSINPKDYGFSNKIDFSKIDIQKRRQLFSLDKGSYSKTPTDGIINNIVVFIRFSDEGEFNQPISYYDLMFNNTDTDANSMTNYFKEVSYNKLNVTSFYYPLTSSNVISFQDSHPRAYYQPSTGPNSIGYITIMKVQHESIYCLKMLLRIFPHLCLQI